MSLLALERVDAGYGERGVLFGVSLRVAAGEIVGLVGPNGAGKSTIIRVATGVLPVTAGAVRLDGRAVAALRPEARARLAAVVPQSAAVPGTFTAFETVMLGRTPYLGLLRGESASDRAIARAAMERTGTWAFRERRVGRLSGGERQRVLVARALAQGAPLLLLDEPTNHLDIRAQAETLALVRDLARAHGHGVLAALHDLTLAAQVCDRLLLLAEGRVQHEGPPGEVLTAETLRDTYGASTVVLAHPHNARPVVVPVLGEGG